MSNKLDFVYQDTVDFINCIISDYDFYGEMIKMLQSGNAEVMLQKKQLLKQIDENWVLAIESALPALDMVIRNPSRALQEHEQVLPIELSRSITAKSIRHLAQHTDYINDIDKEGNITPSKILNVYRDETIDTYENRFVNTLLDRLFFFVEKRYSYLKELSQDENSTLLAFETSMESDHTKANIKFSIEVTEHEVAQQETNEFGIMITKTSLWERVERVRKILSTYLASSFAKTLKGKMIRPPIMRTNAIMKNKELHACLSLWQYIESYDKIGYEIRSNQTLEAPTPAYIKELYSLLALQYVTFKYNIDGALNVEKALVQEQSDEPITPRIITELEPLEVEDFNVYDVQTQKYVKLSQVTSHKRLTPAEVQIRDAIDFALQADKIIKELAIKQQKEQERIAEEKRQAIEKERQRKLKEKETERLRKQKEKDKRKKHSKKARTRAKQEKRNQPKG